MSATQRMQSVPAPGGAVRPAQERPDAPRSRQPATPAKRQPEPDATREPTPRPRDPELRIDLHV